jgi:hypothetical protein
MMVFGSQHNNKNKPIELLTLVIWSCYLFRSTFLDQIQAVSSNTFLVIELSYYGSVSVLLITIIYRIQPSRSCKNFSNFKVFQNLKFKWIHIRTVHETAWRWSQMRTETCSSCQITNVSNSMCLFLCWWPNPTNHDTQQDANSEDKLMELRGDSDTLYGESEKYLFHFASRWQVEHANNPATMYHVGLTFWWPVQVIMSPSPVQYGHTISRSVF